MAAQQSIVINGDLGSGKTTVSVMLAQRLGVRRISVGDIYRRMAEERGMTALQLNLHAELDDEVDGYVDRLQREIARSGEQLVVDSRLAWFFFTDALKVHLMVDPTVGAGRVLARPDKAETYSSLAEAKQRLRERSESERVRFLTRYGADKTRLRNYDLVCDSTRAQPEEIVEHVIAAFEGRLAPEVVRENPPLILADPARIYPTQEIGVLRDLDGAPDTTPPADEPAPPLRLGHADGHLFVVDGHRRLSQALRSGSRLVAASLAAEGDEVVVGGLSARSYFEAEVGRSMIYDWCAAHGTDLPLPPHLARAGAGTVAE
ncbi:MAG TPA: AAA family ATPase [Natronosporangium sp.]|nr:AAA family ATPase [Natronosporangium sp.]